MIVPRHMQRDPDLARVVHTRHCMSRETAKHGDTATAARHEHDARGLRFFVERFSQPVAVEFGCRVEIVNTIANGCLHQGIGGAQIN